MISVDSSLKVPGERTSVYAQRSRNPLIINLQIDTAKKTLLITPKSSAAYWLNICFNYGIGMLVDKNNPKRYALPRRIYLQQEGNDAVARRFAPALKGSINWHIALPHANSFYIKIPEGYRNSIGFWGIESGLDYFYKDNRYLSVYGGAATDFFVPVPAAVDILGEYQSSSGIFANARSNYRTGSFDLGYGISYSTLLWRKTNRTDPEFSPKSKTNSALGFSFNSSYRFGKAFQLGLLYQPYLFRIDNKVQFDYQHQISIELIWKIPVRRASAEE